MKNTFFYSLLSSFFFLASFSLVNATYYSGQNAVIEADCHFRTGAVISFQIPEKYLDKNGQLTHPIQISVLKNGNKTPVYNIQSMTLQINIPVDLHGDYLISLCIGNYFTSQKISVP